jgi:hypothetical protein
MTLSFVIILATISNCLNAISGGGRNLNLWSQLVVVSI